MNTSLVCVVVSVACAAACFGQQAQTFAGFSPVPTITAGAAIPDDSLQYVFLGPTIRDVTLSYPRGLASGTRSGLRQTYKLRMLNQVAPTVSTAVTANADGSYDYTYTVQNDATAVDPIRVWSIAMPAVNAVSSAHHSVWSVTAEAAPGNAAARADSVSMTPVVFAAWRSSNGSAIGPGKTLSEVHITSPYSPGFTILYARSAEDYAVPPDVPQEVRDQLDALRAPEWRDRAILVIGPRFPKEWGREFVAGDFSAGIARLVKDGQLSADSKFVSSIVSRLDAIAKLAGGVTSVGDVLSLAGSAKELDIAHALAISLP